MNLQSIQNNHTGESDQKLTIGNVDNFLWESQNEDNTNFTCQPDKTSYFGFKPAPIEQNSPSGTNVNSDQSPLLYERGPSREEIVKTQLSGQVNSSNMKIVEPPNSSLGQI